MEVRTSVMGRSSRWRRSLVVQRIWEGSSPSGKRRSSSSCSSAEKEGVRSYVVKLTGQCHAWYSDGMSWDRRLMGSLLRECSPSIARSLPGSWIPLLSAPHLRGGYIGGSFPE